MLENTVRGLEKTDLNIPSFGHAFVSDAIEAGKKTPSPMISTDPPYYDMIPYADLSDFFYVWLRKLLSEIYPDLFDTLMTPKSKEMIADANRAGGADEAKAFFEEGIFKAFSHFREVVDRNYPVTVYYAYKQKESKKDKQVSTGWETILSGIIDSGFTITGTWPIRTERAMKVASIGANVLASSIVLVCRPRELDIPAVTRKEFLVALRKELSPAIQQLQQGNIAPVDLAQAAIGPGISVLSRYSRVLEADGSPMTVRTALKLINQMLDEHMAEQEGFFDGDTRWALAWFEQYGHDKGPFGAAETLSKAKNTSISGLEQAGILEARAGQVRILHRDELYDDWDPEQDKRFTVWEATQYLVKTLDKEGETSAAQLASRLGGQAEDARNLAYRLFLLCERKKWAKEALAYNMLVVSWPGLKDIFLSFEKSKQINLL